MTRIAMEKNRKPGSDVEERSPAYERIEYAPIPVKASPTMLPATQNAGKLCLLLQSSIYPLIFSQSYLVPTVVSVMNSVQQNTSLFVLTAYELVTVPQEDAQTLRGRSIRKVLRSAGC